ncbi:MAG: chloride channel protein, partial [Acidimicrobiales bacterium]
GSGGSGGREGPTAQISAGFGSLLARVLDLSPADGRLAVSVGIGSGIGSIFGAPLGGALLSAEILYRDDFEVDALIPSIIASVVGYTTFSAFEGFRPLFGFAASGYHFGDPIQLAWYALIGVVAGFVGLGYAKVFYGVAGLFERLPVARAIRPAIGGLMVGAIAIALPQVLGTGYGWIQKALGQQLLSLPLWVVLVLPLAKILATSLSIGSGGSGGIFGPGIFIGAFSGAAVWRLLAPIAPGIPHDPAPFVIVGMMACFGAIARAPLAVMLMVAEMTGSVTALAPALIAVGLATLIVQRSGDTIYRSQLRTRDDSPARRLRASMPLLSSLAVTEFMGPPRVIFDARNGAGEAADKLTRDGLPGAPVVDEREAFIGVVARDRLREAAGGEDVEATGDDIEVGRLADPTVPTATAGDNLDSALEALLASDANWIPVLDDQRRVVGILSVSGVVHGYRAGLASNLRQISRVASGTAVVDLELGEASMLIGRRLRDADLPAGTIVMTLQRGTELILPRGDTALESGDRVGVLTHATDAEEVRHLIEGSGDGPGPWPDSPSGGS